MKTRMWTLLTAIALTLTCSLGMTACGDGGGESIEIDGSSTVYPISQAVAEVFNKESKDATVSVAFSGTGGGFKRFTKGETQISDASRPIKAKEAEAAKSAGIEFIELPIAYDGLSIVVNKENDWAEHLTVVELKKMFRAAPDAPKKWSEVRADFPDEEIKIFMPGTDSGTFDYFKEVILGKDEKAAIRSDVSTSEDDNVLVTGVAGERGGIGFFGSAYYFENKDKIKGVAIDGGAGPVLPTPETIENGTYAPFSRPLFIYVNKKMAEQSPALDKFVKFYLDNAGKMAAEVGYVALPENIFSQVRKAYETKTAGSFFLTEEGEKKEGSLGELYKVD